MAAPDTTSWTIPPRRSLRSEEHTSELQSHLNFVSRLLLEKKKSSLLSGPENETLFLTTGIRCRFRDKPGYARAALTLLKSIKPLCPSVEINCTRTCSQTST